MTIADNVAGVSVEIGFGVDAVGGDYFVLDDATKGELDNETYLLAPDTVFVDVTDKVASITISRGRERELDEYGTGRATVIINDDDRTFDPAYSGSTYAGQLVPMRRIRIAWKGAPLFTGWVDDWTVSYEPGNTLSHVQVACVDAFAILANQELASLSPTLSGDLTGERVGNVLDRPEVDFPASRSIDTGTSILGATTMGDNALAYLQAVTRAEAGALFVAADGTLTFKARTASLNRNAEVVFSDDRTAGIPYLDVTQRSAADLLFNRVTAESETTENEVVAEDADEKDNYFTRTLSLGRLFTIDDVQTQNIADYYLDRFSQPELRFQMATVNVGALDEVDVAALVGLDLTDVVTVERWPLQVGTKISRSSMVDGINHRISHVNGRLEWRAELSFANADTRDFLILDDTDFGVLDSNRLAF